MKHGAVVILSYNSATLSIALARRIVSTLPAWDVILVDNASDDVSELRGFVDQIGSRVELVESGGNLGYARGNNLGLRRAREKGYRWAAIANPDVELPEPEVVEELVGIIQGQPGIAVAGPRILNPLGQEQLPPLRADRRLLFNLLYPLSGWILRTRNRRLESTFGWRYVFTVHGCFFVLDLEAWCVVGDFDESTFLYHEESIMADRLTAAGYAIVYAPARSVLHQHIYGPDFRENHWDRESWLYYRKVYLRRGEFFDRLLDSSEHWRMFLNKHLDTLRNLLIHRKTK